MKRIRQLAKTFCAIVMTLWLVFVSLFLFRFCYQPLPVSGQNLSRSEVKRLRMPEDAEDISYYYSTSPLGPSYHATYRASESSIRAFFPSWEWVEIKTPIHFRRNYGQSLYNTEVQEKTGEDVTIANGIQTEIIFGNGGGYRAQFDRDTGYFHIERVRN